jgi:ABC-2 type transport system permease protein
VGRLATGTRLRLVELVRQPVTLGMLLALPPVVVELYGVALASFPMDPSAAADPATIGRMTGTLFAVAFLAGLIGLFQVISAEAGDERLAVAGLPRSAMLGARLAAMVAVAVLAASVAFAVLSVRVDVAAPPLAFAVLVLAGLLYGLLGVVVGSLVPRELEGSLVLVFLADVDNALSSGLFPVEWSARLPVVGDVALVELAPLFHAHELFAAAVLDGELAGGHVAPTVAWVVVLVVVAFVGYVHSTGDGSLGGWLA